MDVLIAYADTRKDSDIIDKARDGVAGLITRQTKVIVNRDMDISDFLNQTGGSALRKYEIINWQKVETPLIQGKFEVGGIYYLATNEPVPVFTPRVLSERQKFG